MDDTISRKAAVSRMSDLLVLELGYKRLPTWNEIYRAMQEMPSAQPIIHCKECKHWYNDADAGMACDYTNMSQPEDGFCNWAERKGEEK